MFQVPVGNRVGSNPFIRTTFFGQNRWILLFFLCEKPETARLFVIKLIVLGQNLGNFGENRNRILRFVQADILLDSPYRRFR